MDTCFRRSEGFLDVPADTNPLMSRTGRHTLDRILADSRANRLIR
jgi:hypothetical protein